MTLEKKTSFAHTRRRKREIAAAGKKRFIYSGNRGVGFSHSWTERASYRLSIFWFPFLSLSFSLSPSSCRSLTSPFFGTLKGKCWIQQLSPRCVFTSNKDTAPRPGKIVWPTYRNAVDISYTVRIHGDTFLVNILPCAKKKGVKVLVLSLFSSSKAHPTSSPLSSASASPRSKKGLKLNTSIFSPPPACLFLPPLPGPLSSRHCIAPFIPYPHILMAHGKKSHEICFVRNCRILLCPRRRKNKSQPIRLRKLALQPFPFPHHNTISFPSSLFFPCTRQFCAASSHPAGEPTFWGRQG